jgi:dCMP deaminase
MCSDARKLQYDKTYLKIAEDISGLSYGVRAKVGCIIVSPDGQIISHGWNGTPSGFDNCCEYKDSEGNLHTKPEVLHAESNAIMKCAKNMVSTNKSSLYVTLSPCFECAKLIIQSGIKKVYYKEEYRDLSGIDFLKDNGIEVIKL